MNNQITLSNAIEGYLIDARARRLSPCTIADYKNGFRHLCNFLDNDPLIASITRTHVKHFLLHLAETPITPAGCAARPVRTLSNKSILNIHTALSALWAWAIIEEIIEDNVVRAVKPPKPKKTVIVPFTKEDLQEILKACRQTASYTRPGKRECANARATADRDRAIILTLLDTGARASELCADPRRDAPGARISDFDQRSGTIKVLGKGNKERIILVSARTHKAIWRYLASRTDIRPDDPLFITANGGANHPLTSTALLRLIQRLGKRAGVDNAHPHRFRHTFAINFLRNGGNALELQHLLGHSTLEMVRRYVALAQVDLDTAMRRASPVDNWRL